MKWIGLTGGIASGKSTVSQILRELSYDVVDADKVAHEVVDKGTAGLKAVTSTFGPQILNLDGSLDRRKLGQLVFGDPINLHKLESLLHPLVRQRVQDLKSDLERSGKAFAFYDVPLLFEKKMSRDFSAVVVVACSPELQVERLRQRNLLSESEIEMRMASQIPLVKKVAQADLVIWNDAGMEKLHGEVQRMLVFLGA